MIAIGKYIGIGRSGSRSWTPLSLLRNSDIIEISGYANLSTTYNIGLAADRSYANMNNSMKIRQNGAITKIAVNLGSTQYITAFYIDVWRKEGATWDRIAHQNIVSLIANGLNNITLPSSINVNEGDYVCISGSITAGSGHITSVEGRGNSYFTNSFPTDTNYDWTSATLLSGFAVSLKTYGQAPMAVGIGDSIMAGHNSHYSMIEVSEVVSLTDHPMAYLTAINSKYVNQNMGIGGQNSTQVAARFTADCVNLKPKLAIIAVGVNDIAQSVNKNIYITNMTNILDACETAGIIPVVCKILPWTNGTNTQMQTRDDWMLTLKTLVEAYSGSVWVNFDSDIGMFRSGGDDGNLWDIKTSPDYNDDGVHLTSLGKSKMADVINTAILTKYILA